MAAPMLIALLLFLCGYGVLVGVLVHKQQGSAVAEPPGNGPECKFLCDDPICKALCVAECAPPRCEVACEGDATCVATLHCSTRCADDQLPTDSCPACETVCEPLIGCALCQPLCEAPMCSWNCAKPTACPAPRCELQCEQVACASEQ